jgi:hydroxypyruvate reductase
MIEGRDDLASTPAHALALDCLQAGISAAHPETVVETSVALDGGTLTVAGAKYDLGEYDRLLVVGGGNAAGHVAAALEARLADRIDDGVVVTDDPAPTETVACVEGSHPIPDEAALDGARRVLALAESATENDLLLVVLAGGGSALLPAPADGLALADLRAVTESLLTSGAAIGEVNAVRKHLSTIKGGRLARAATPASVVGLAFSDVVGNDLSAVASGPITPDETTFVDALDVLDRYDVDAPATVCDHLRAGRDDERRETPAPDHPAFDRVSVHVLADSFTALTAASDVASARGYDPLILSSRIRGEAREVAHVHVGVAEEAVATGNPVDPPAVVLSGGETTVTVSGDGDGGPNQEFALSAALELDDPGVVVGAVDTDGIDGNVDAAGALVDDRTLDDVGDARRALARNDAYGALEAAGALVRTGPTGTNVNDLRVVAIPDR